MNNPYLLTGLQFTPIVAERIFSQIDPSRWDERLDPERFTPREAIAHMADWEPIMRERVKIAAQEPGSTMPAYDESQRAIDNHYSETDPLEQLSIWKRERNTTLKYLGSLSGDIWNNAATHPERGAVTADDLSQTITSHDVYHLEHLTEFLPN